MLYIDDTPGIKAAEFTGTPEKDNADIGIAFDDPSEDALIDCKDALDIAYGQIKDKDTLTKDEALSISVVLVPIKEAAGVTTPDEIAVECFNGKQACRLFTAKAKEALQASIKDVDNRIIAITSAKYFKNKNN